VARETWTNRSVVRDGTAQAITYEGFDCVGFVERHVVIRVIRLFFTEVARTLSEKTFNA
jgi:hypothetical protein